MRRLRRGAKVEKDDAAAEWDALSSWAVRTITGLFILAGRPELAARVLPPVPRRGRTEAADGEGGGEADTEAEGSGAPVSDEPGSSPPPGDEPPPPDPSASEPSP